MSAHIGRYIEDRFHVTDVIGEGGMSVVYGATDVISRRRLALKVLKSDSPDPAIRERFLREAQSMASIQSKHVAQVFHFGRDMELGVLYIAMEFCDGDEVFRLLEHGRMPLSLAMEIAIQTCQGLANAHAKGVIHRDVKPANLMLVPHKGGLRLKLLDFGFVRVENSHAMLTNAGFVAGTLSYASPEELELRELDHRLDIYSLGCVLFELLTGRPPFVAKTSHATAVLHLTQPPPRLAPEFGPSELGDLIEWMLQKNPDERPQTALEVADYLERIREAHQVQPPAITHMGRSKDPKVAWGILPV